MKKTLLMILICLSGCSSRQDQHKRVDPLPSWNNTGTKQAIIDYVKKIADKDSKDFIPVEDRIATFDNDGTLWAETPPNQILYVQDKAGRLGIKHKPLKEMKEKEILELLLKTHTGMSTEDYQQDVNQFFNSAVHPVLKVPYAKTVYQPQLELLNYLTANGFKVYICSGGTADFMRVISEKIYNVPPEQVIGTDFQFKFNDTRNTLVILPKVHDMNDKETKAHEIHRIIGKRPVFAAGNVRSGGDIYMLRYSQGSSYPTFQLMINHDDGWREFFYQEKDDISLKWAEKYKWNVLSIKNDWNQVFVK